MNNKTAIVMVIVAILLLGGGLYFLSSKNKPKVSTSVVPTVTSQPNAEGVKKSIKELLAAGIPQKCSFKDTSGSIDMEGSTFIAGGKVRGDFTSTAEDKTGEGHMIYDGKASYIWMDGNKTGMKIEIDPEKMESQSSSQGLDMSKNIDYNCGPWVTDESLFAPPKDITFATFGLPTGSQTQGSSSGSQNLCNTCNSLAGEQKTQCLKAFNCQ